MSSYLIGLSQNLVANVLWAVPALFHIHYKLNKIHAKINGQSNPPETR